jgi:hypothetical protein
VVVDEPFETAGVGWPRSARLGSDAAALVLGEPTEDPLQRGVREAVGPAWLHDRAGTAKNDRRLKPLAALGEEHVGGIAAHTMCRPASDTGHVLKVRSEERASRAGHLGRLEFVAAPPHPEAQLQAGRVGRLGRVRRLLCWRRDQAEGAGGGGGRVWVHRPHVRRRRPPIVPRSFPPSMPARRSVPTTTCREDESRSATHRGRASYAGRRCPYRLVS